jgi:hypothetical protein
VRYLCLVYHEETDAGNGNGTVAGDAFGASSVVLLPVQDGASVRVDHGRLDIRDGDAGPTRHRLSGFCLLDARDLNDAIRQAAKLPAAEGGWIDVRPVAEPVA